MAWVGAGGNAVGTQPVTIQVEIPCEPVGDQGRTLAAVNWGGVLAAAIQLVIAMMSGDAVKIAAAIQALLTAFMS